MYKPRNFKSFELVDRKTYRALGEKCLRLFRAETLMGIDQLRDLIGNPMMVNDWAWDGKIEWRGFRPSYCEIGATYSMHKVGSAIDFRVKGENSPEFYKDLRDKIVVWKDECFLPYLSRMEDLDGMTWCHVEFDSTAGNKVKLFKP